MTQHESRLATFAYSTGPAPPHKRNWARLLSCDSFSSGDIGMAAGRTKGTVGVIGLGIMGGAFAKNLARAGWRVVGYDISAARRREAAARRRHNRQERRRRRRPRADRPHQPAQAAGADRHRAQDRRRQAPAKIDRGDEHLHDYGQGKSPRHPRQGRPCDARYAGQRHRRPGRQPRPGVLRQRQYRGHQAAQADAGDLRPPRLRRRRLRQWQQDEIRGESSGRHQQRRRAPRPWCSA